MIQVGENVTLIDFKESAKILKYKSKQVEIKTECNDSIFLVLRITTTLYGSEKNVLRVNYNLRGVIVPRGKSKVLLIFHPLSSRIGAAILQGPHQSA